MLPMVGHTQIILGQVLKSTFPVSAYTQYLAATMSASTRLAVMIDDKILCSSSESDLTKVEGSGYPNYLT
jgi:hypothetical protein